MLITVFAMIYWTLVPFRGKIASYSGVPTSVEQKSYTQTLRHRKSACTVGIRVFVGASTTKMVASVD